MKKPLRIEVAIAALLLAPIIGYGIAFLVSNAEGAQVSAGVVAVSEDALPADRDDDLGADA